MHAILGGTHGLGLEVARELQARGYKTFTVGRTYDPGIHGAGLRADLAQNENAARAAAELSSMDLDGFWWLAGYSYVGDFASQDDPQRMAAVNFANAMPVAQAAWRVLLQSKAGGPYVVVASVTGTIKNRTNEAVYAGTKAAQAAFARSLGLESERLGGKARVALFLPGGMQTPFWDGHRPDAYSDYLDPVKVARKICDAVLAQTDVFYEEAIERGSL